MKQTRKHRTVKIWQRVGLALGGLALAVGVLAYATYDPNPVGHFRTEAGRQAYRAAMPQLPAPTRTWDVPTDFGTVRVYRFSPAGAQDETPLMLLPGTLSGTPMWTTNLPRPKAVTRALRPRRSSVKPG